MMETGEKKPIILVVDDAPMTVDVICVMLEFVGYQTKRGYGGEECLEILKEMNPKPDLVLLNSYMPVDGWETLGKIKSNPETQHIPVIMESVHEPSKQHLEKYGTLFEAFLSKPFTHSQLISAIKSALMKTNVSEIND
jgi:two-component system OmpR family response regulator